MVAKPFDEDKVIFIYYANSSQYSKYRLGNDSIIKLNLDLMKSIDDPQERANLNHRFAQKAVEYILAQVIT
ncbi:MAG: hypothetical protein H0W88_11070 [Parachlamydiaceae bacterium]|nr:hypothetical protein [Parachlamydiaceae bacterium]